MDIFEGAKEFARELTRAINNSNNIRIISHLDADGITSASIVVKFLKSKNKIFHLTIVKQLTNREIEEMKRESYDLYILTDLGSGKIDELERIEKNIFIIDHHQIFGDVKRVKLFNPYLFNLDGSKDASASTCTYLVFKNMGLEDSAHLAVVGAIGDNQEDENGLIGINRWVLENTDEVEVKKGLRIFGRKSKPIHTALSQSLEINIPGISGDESKTVQFLSELGIKIKDENGFRTLSSLSEEESKKLINQMIIKGMGSNDDLNKLFGYVYDIKNKKGILSDAREFATLLNSFGRQNLAGLGVEVCIGNENQETIKEVLREYKKKIVESIDWVKENLKEKNGIKYVIAKDRVPDTMIGTIISMLIREEEGTIIGLADSEYNVKVSARSNEDVNLGKIMEKIAKKVGGEGGGHKRAAGASIPKGKEEEFINLVIEEITWQKGKLEGKRSGYL